MIPECNGLAVDIQIQSLLNLSGDIVKREREQI
jgi:hypothetical protein